MPARVKAAPVVPARVKAVPVRSARAKAPVTPAQAEKSAGRGATGKPAATTTGPAKVVHPRTTAAPTRTAAHAEPAERVRVVTAVAPMPSHRHHGVEAFLQQPVVVTARPSRRRSRSPRPVVPVALGSLTQPGARNGDSCAVCGSTRVTGLALLLTDGTPVRFTSCHACEHRSWVGPDGELDRATVLERTRKVR
jgi:hypothetical protein